MVILYIQIEPYIMKLEFQDHHQADKISTHVMYQKPTKTDTHLHDFSPIHLETTKIIKLKEGRKDTRMVQVRIGRGYTHLQPVLHIRVTKLQLRPVASSTPIESMEFRPLLIIISLYKVQVRIGRNYAHLQPILVVQKIGRASW